mmetsp:Transcript_9792/g.18185  ORF Transcript_9792/g.18185 Transcript_9792/m.18185 type:complete len:350 (-) Transcript_9792:82-1131(-)
MAARASADMVICIKAPAAFSCAMSDVFFRSSASFGTAPKRAIASLFFSWPTVKFQIAYAASCACDAPERRSTSFLKMPASASLSWFSGLSWHKLPSTAADISWSDESELESKSLNLGTAPPAIISVPMSDPGCETPASVSINMSFNAASWVLLSPNIFDNGVASPSVAICTQSSSSPLHFSSICLTASISPACIRLASSRTDAGAGVVGLGAALAGWILVVTFVVDAAPLIFFSGTALGSAGFSWPFATRPGKRCMSRLCISNCCRLLSVSLALGAPSTASARSSSGSISGRGVKSIHVPSGKEFHQNRSATKASLMPLSKCSYTAHPRTTSMPAALAARSAFEKLCKG